MALLLALLRRIISEPDRIEVGHFILREQMQPTAAMDLLYAQMLLPLHQLLAQQVATLRGQSTEAPEILIEAQALFGEVIVFSAHRTTLARRLAGSHPAALEYERYAQVVRAMVLRQFPLSSA